MSAWPDLTSLELLVAIADHGSVGAAARAVGVAQPNATRSIGRLERALGVDLVVRSTRGSTLTPAGMTIVELARRTLSAATDFTETARSLRAGEGATMRVAASQTIAEHLVPTWLSALRTSHPQTAVELHVHNSHDVVDDLRAGRVGLGFVEDPTVPRDVHSTVVAHGQMVLVVAPPHVWATRRKPLTPEELARTPLITREAGSGTRVALDRALGVAVTPYLELPSNAAVRVSVASGAAPAVLSRLAVVDAIAVGSLVPVPLALRLDRPLRAVWIGQRRLSGVAADLVAIAGQAERAIRSRRPAH